MGTMFADVHGLEFAITALQQSMHQVCLLLQHVRARSPSQVGKEAFEWLDKSTIDLKSTPENPSSTDARTADLTPVPENSPSVATRSSPALGDGPAPLQSANALSSEALRNEMVRRLRDAATTGEDAHTEILNRLDALGEKGRKLAEKADTPAESSVEVLEAEIRNAVVENSTSLHTLPG